MRRWIQVCLACALFWGALDVASSESVPPIAYKYRNDLIRTSRFVFGLTAPSATFGAQIHAESHWDANARSRAGAVGLSQFIPSTSRYMGRRYADLRSVAPLTPAWSLLALARYNWENWQHLHALEAQPCLRMKMTLASYNAGPGVLKRKRWPRETQRYVYRILQVLEPVYVAKGWGLGSCH